MKKDSELPTGCGLLSILLLILLPFGGCIFHRVTVDEVEITVLEKERVIRGNRNSYYEIRAASENFRNSDSWAFWKFDSSDLQRDLKINGTYRVRVSGMRWQFMSWFRNIINIEKVISEESNQNQTLVEKLRVLIDNEKISDDAFRSIVKDLIE